MTSFQVSLSLLCNGNRDNGFDELSGIFIDGISVFLFPCLEKVGVNGGSCNSNQGQNIWKKIWNSSKIKQCQQV